jgi:hypothetical protein
VHARQSIPISAIAIFKHSTNGGDGEPFGAAVGLDHFCQPPGVKGIWWKIFRLSVFHTLAGLQYIMTRIAGKGQI